MHDVAVPDRACVFGDEAALLVRHDSGTGDAREAVSPEQAVYGALRGRIAWYGSGALEQQADLADRAARVLAFGRKHGALHSLAELRRAAVSARLADQSRDAFAAPEVVPGAQRLLADMPAFGAGNRVLLLRDLANQASEFTAGECAAAGERAEYAQTEQRHLVDAIHVVNSFIKLKN